jgi:hypothetical protein
MEQTTRVLLLKIAAARQLLTAATPFDVSAVSLLLLVDAIECRFALMAGRLFAEAAAGELRRCNAQLEFQRLVVADSYAAQLDGLADQCTARLVDRGMILRSSGRVRRRAADTAVHVMLQHALDVYPRGTADAADVVVDFTHCRACGCEMRVDAMRSELTCASCGCVFELVGTVFDDFQFYTQEGQKSKSGTFNPNRHFQFWWTHILARESEEELLDERDVDNMCGDFVLRSVRTMVARERLILRRIDVNTVRAVLRDINRTNLNRNVPLILKKVTGVGPPQLSEAIEVRVENLFTKAIEASEHIARRGRVNRNYYPYYIYKILDLILPLSADRRILFYIYIQSSETVESDDADWERICAEVPELTYRPTDRSEYMQYVPM